MDGANAAVDPVINIDHSGRHLKPLSGTGNCTRMHRPVRQNQRIDRLLIALEFYGNTANQPVIPALTAIYTYNTRPPTQHLAMHTLDTLPLTNSFAALPAAFHTRVQPTPLLQPAQLIHFNPAAAALLNLDPATAGEHSFADIFSGRQSLPGADPVAMRYAGHQFGHYVAQLGDGRAIVLGETTTAAGERWEIQLKGAGQTPYSRDGDGRAVLRSTIREYLCSEAMHGLGIPTTRALCITGTDDEVYREQIETAAVLTRLAPSHVRFGSFELFFYNNLHDE